MGNINLHNMHVFLSLGTYNVSTYTFIYDVGVWWSSVFDCKFAQQHRLNSWLLLLYWQQGLYCDFRLYMRYQAQYVWGGIVWSLEGWHKDKGGQLHLPHHYSQHKLYSSVHTRLCGHFWPRGGGESDIVSLQLPLTECHQTQRDDCGSSEAAAKGLTFF